ncbi:hypothetical protein B2D45_12655, partial [Lactobacillus hilgardii]
MKKYRKYLIAVMSLLLIVVGLTACGKSTAQDLQSHQWTFASSKDNGMAATAKKLFEISKSGVGKLRQTL